jgi:curved DNA-binding protein CbpA
MSGTSHYETLGVARDASAEEIEKAYRRLRKRVHPDAQGSHGLFIHVQTAYETLSDPQKRRTYDAGIEEPAARPGANPPPQSRQPRSSWQPSGPPPDLSLPAALPRMAGAVHYQPPLQVPELPSPPPAERVHRVAGWAKITFIAVGSLAVLIGLLTLLNGLRGIGLESRTITNSVAITVFFLIIAVIPVIISQAIGRCRRVASRTHQPPRLRPARRPRSGRTGSDLAT